MQSPENSVATKAQHNNGMVRSPNARRRMRLSVLAVVCAVAYTGLTQRDAVVGLAPQLGPAFRVAGLPVNLAGADIRSVRAWIEHHGADQSLVIEGEILNLRRGLNTVPDIRLSLVDGKGEVLYTWVAPLTGKSMKPGEKLSFKTHLASPPAANRKVVVSFAS